VLAAAMAITAAGCAGPTGRSAPAATAAGPSQATCDQLFAAEPGRGPDLVVMVDRTRDSPLSTLPTSAAQKIQETAQAAGTLTLLSVNGAGAAPLVVLDHASLMDTGAGSARARRISALTPACVQREIARAEPTAAGSDQLRALQEVARRTPDGGEALVLSNGVSTAGTLDMTRLPVVAVDAAAVAQAVPAAELPQGDGRTFTFYGLGEVDPPVSQTARSWIADVTMALCRRSGATCERSDEIGKRLPATDRGAVPEDGQVAWPVPEKVQLPDGSRRTDVPAALLFAFDSAQLSPDAVAVVASVTADLGNAATLEVVGHTDSACPPDPRVCRDLSLQRAQAVADLLQRQHWDGPVPDIRVDGVGPDQPLVADRDGHGNLVPAAAARNRRVSITAR
jgi:outer membrane protein OmpA-like peptidoglycan-associated protein